MTIDVFMPFYGDVTLMQEAVRSVLAQRDQDWRLTVVDDGQPVDVAGWFTELGDPRVRYLRNERNLGVTGNFNRCLDLVEHDLVVLVGNDDLMLPDYVGRVRALHARFPTAGIVQPGVEVVDQHGAPALGLVDRGKRRAYAPRVEGPTAFSGEDLAVSLLRANWLFFPSLCWKADAVREVRFREEFTVVQDLALVLDLVARGVVLVADDEVCFRYRKHVGSETSRAISDGTSYTEAGNLFHEYGDRFAALGWNRAARVARSHVLWRLLALASLPAARSNPAAAKVLLKHAFGR
ncbi:glycosyltransferase family 2 protein [Saccharothrix sp. Mg75]|uniref:glycosyltransferase family 2 protein n=1 Tax=Saccharothrix sp. Mg75 TaxID=3445357 RepID=UPI003EE9C1FA